MREEICCLDIKMGKKEIVKNLSEFRKNLNDVFPVEKMIFFGSRTKGKARGYADIDLIIVSKKFEKMNFFERASAMYNFWHISMPVDFLCYSPREFQKRVRQISIVREALQQGIEIK